MYLGLLLMNFDILQSFIFQHDIMWCDLQFCSKSLFLLLRSLFYVFKLHIFRIPN